MWKRLRLVSAWDRLQTSFWFVPSLLAVAAIALAYVAVAIDQALTRQDIRQMAWLYGFGPEGARAILSAIASSMMTVTGLTFSITVVTLQLASSQFGPRILRNFMRDRGNQIVLGIFISTFIYCLLVLRTVNGREGEAMVPHLAVAVGVLLAMTSLAFLIYFIHHVATSIRIESVLAELSEETRETIDRLYPDKVGDEPEPTLADSLPHGFEDDPGQIRAKQSGYVQRLDEDALLKLASEHDLRIRILARPGRFVAESDAVMAVAPQGELSPALVDALADTLIIGTVRTPVHDLEFSLARIVEIAQRALSPGMNDPTTAIYCIDRLGEALGRLAERDRPSPLRVDAGGAVRIVTEVVSIEEIARSCVAAIARYALSDADVVLRLTDMLGSVAKKTPPATAARLHALADAVREDGLAESRLALDRKLLSRSAGEAEPVTSSADSRS